MAVMREAASKRYFIVVMTRAGFDLPRSSSRSGSCQPPTSAVKARRVESGDQANPPGAKTPFCTSVSTTASPPSEGIT
jgi:hypothetical protein